MLPAGADQGLLCSITHHFKFDQILDAYDTFARAVETKTLKVIIEA